MPKNKVEPCKYCENPVAIGVKKCPQCGGKNPIEVKNTLAQKIAFVVIMIGIFWVIIEANGPYDGRPRREESRTRTSIIAGSEVVVARSACFAAVSLEALDRLQTLAQAGDDAGIVNMLASGTAFSLEKGTRARAIDAFVLKGAWEIRVLDGTHAGKAVYVHAAFLQPG